MQNISAPGAKMIFIAPVAFMSVRDYYFASFLGTFFNTDIAHTGPDAGYEERRHKWTKYTKPKKRLAAA